MDKNIQTSIENTVKKPRNIQDHIFMVKKITEKFVRQNRKIYAGFTNLDKMFKNKLRKILAERGINKKRTQIMKNIHRNKRNHVVIQNKISKVFTTTVSLRKRSESDIIHIIKKNIKRNVHERSRNFT